MTRLFGSQVARLAGAVLCCLLLSAAFRSAASHASPESETPPANREEAGLPQLAVPVDPQLVELAALHVSSGSPPAPANWASEDRSELLVRVDRELADIDALLVSSHFHAVLAVAEKTRELLNTVEREPELGMRRARLEVMVATAEIALGRRAMAEQSMVRALRAQPALSLDEHKTSPKVLGLLKEARRLADIGQPKP